MKKIIIFLSAAMLAVSCMDLSPKAQMSDAQVWTKASNFTLFSNQFYGWLMDLKNVASDTNDSFWSEYRTDLMCTKTVNVYSEGTNTIPSTDGNYGTSYKRLYYTNLLLQNAESYANPAEIAEPVGEAYFFRAYIHFQLVQMYGDCILADHAFDIDSPELFAKRNDRLDVINLCIADLKKAAELLPDAPREAGRVNKHAAWALLSRIALYEGCWQKYHKNADATTLFAEAANAAKQVMDSKAYELFFSSKLGGKDSYRYMFILENVDCNPAKLTKADNKEYILAYRHDETLKTCGINVTHGLLNNVAYVTAKLADMYRCQDGLPISKSPLFKGYAGSTSEFTNRDNRMAGTLLQIGQKHWNNDGTWRENWDDTDLEKCLTAGLNTAGSGYAPYKWCTERQVPDTQEAYDFPVIRYAEVLLNYAEAIYEQNNAITDDQLNASLNLVRKRSNPEMTPLSNSLVSANGLNMLEEIRAERTIELFLEGFRLGDLRRWKTAETEMPQDLLGVKFTGTWFESNWPNQSRQIDPSTGRLILYTDRVWSEKNYLLPLPSDELQLNPELGQNPGWQTTE